jgi:hypothetical protein
MKESLRKALSLDGRELGEGETLRHTNPTAFQQLLHWRTP